MSTLTVTLNDDGVHSIEAPERFVTNGSFGIELENRGQSAHVFLNLDETLSRVATLGTTNHYVKGERTAHVHVPVDGPVEEPVRGKLKVVTGHGAASDYVTVVVEPPSEEEQPVIVDESLSKPPQRSVEPTPLSAAASTLDSQLQRGILPAALLVAVATLIAVGAVLAVDSAIVFLGALIVIVASLAAAYLVVQ